MERSSCSTKDTRTTFIRREDLSPIRSWQASNLKHCVPNNLLTTPQDYPVNGKWYHYIDTHT